MAPWSDHERAIAPVECEYRAGDYIRIREKTGDGLARFSAPFTSARWGVVYRVWKWRPKLGRYMENLKTVKPGDVIGIAPDNEETQRAQRAWERQR